MQDISFKWFEDRIFHQFSDVEFKDMALQLFRFQYENNKVYADYVNALGVSVSTITKLTDIPFLPISFFKSHPVICGNTEKYEQIFQSSTTTWMYHLNTL